MSEVRRCDEHGFFEGARCPVCDATGRVVITAQRRRRLSKFVSGALRHFPDDAGLDLDDAGWTPYADLVGAVEDKYDWASEEQVAAVVATDPKGRFERTTAADRGSGDGDRVLIRAAYGHSVDVDLEEGGTPVPDALFHGTPTDNLDAIRRDGIQPMSRQKVHLTESVEEAIDVGLRHADDLAILEVDAAGMLADDYQITKRGTSVYTTDEVPPGYLTVRSE